MSLRFGGEILKTVAPLALVQPHIGLPILAVAGAGIVLLTLAGTNSSSNNNNGKGGKDGKK